MSILSVKNLRVEFGDNIVLDRISFVVEKGDFLLILGPNGAGKSVLFKTILGINRQYSGDYKVFGRPIEEVRSKISYVPQYIDFDETFPLTVGEVVRMGLIGIKIKNQVQLIRNVLSELGMEKFCHKFFGELSGGQRKRVLIARALVREPELLLMDEPLAGVDVEGEADFYNLLKKWGENNGLTTVMISHDISLVHRVATKVLCLNVKKICFDQADKITDKSFNKLFGKNVVFHQH